MRYYKINVALWIILSLIIASLLIKLDSIVHSELYDFGLQFSYKWANPYWMCIKTVFVLIGVSCVSSLVLIYLSSKELRNKISYIACPVCNVKIPEDTDICPNCNAVIKQKSQLENE